MDHIPLDECEHGALYRIECRNLAVGLFNGKDNGFIGIRTKFGARYLFTEYHWDTGAPHGTVHPITRLDIMLPADIEVNERGTPADVDKVTGREVAFDKPVVDGGRGWYFKDTGLADDKIIPCFTDNDKLFAFLEKVEEQLGIEKPRGRRTL